MVDLVGTCLLDFWQEWIAEGDAAGDPETGMEYGWHTRHPAARYIYPGDRFYIVSHGLLRGYAPVTLVKSFLDERFGNGKSWVICRKGNAVAISIHEQIPGFQGLRRPWWHRSMEKTFPAWRTLNVK